VAERNLLAAVSAIGEMSEGPTVVTLLKSLLWMPKKYQYIMQFDGPKMGQWTLVIWNKISPDGLVDG
jgi:hypothetical protein